MYICECGAIFNDEQEGAVEHMLEQHLDLIETRFEDFMAEEDEICSKTDVDEVYEDAINDVTEDMLDEIIDGE